MNVLYSTFFISLLLISGGFSQETVVERFQSLSEEQRTEFLKHRQKAFQYQRQKRTFESLEKTHLALKIFKEDQALWNLQGSCYTEFRSFEKARQSYLKALSYDEKNTGVMFNLGEMDFVTKNWSSCIDWMDKLSEGLESQFGKEIKNGSLELHRLAKLKAMLSHLKLAQTDEAVAIFEEYADDWDETPFTYYAKAALAFEQKNEKEARRQIAAAFYVFRDSSKVANWKDTFIEFGYVSTLFGDGDDFINDSIQLD